jgi:hypothetical protein
MRHNARAGNYTWSVALCCGQNRQKDKKSKKAWGFSHFCLFAFFVSRSTFALKPDFKDAPGHQGVGAISGVVNGCGMLGSGLDGS